MPHILIQVQACLYPQWQGSETLTMAHSKAGKYRQLNHLSKLLQHTGHSTVAIGFFSAAKSSKNDGLCVLQPTRQTQLGQQPIYFIATLTDLFKHQNMGLGDTGPVRS